MYRRALALDEKNDLHAGLANDYGVLGLVYHKRGNLEKAEAMYHKALELLGPLGDRPMLAATYGHLGLIYELRGELDQAEIMHRKALEITEQHGWLAETALHHADVGLV